jgi:hypothetical protein
MKTSKDPMIKFRTVMRGFNSKVDSLNPQGGTRIQLYLSNEETAALIETLTATLTNPSGAKVDLHISKKSYENRQFDSAIAFVKPVEGKGVGAGTSAPTRFLPKAATNVASVEDTIAGLKSKAISK